MKLQLRPYQKDIVNNLRKAYREGAQAPLLVSPTGSGKTLVFTYIAESAIKKGNRVMILVHRRELLSQCSDSLDELGVPHGLIAPGKSMTADHVQVASVQTLRNRLDKVMRPDLIVVDECFPAGTMVDGTPIENVKVGDYVTAYDHGRGVLDKQKVVRIYKNPAPKLLVKVTFDNGESIVCTPNHPFYVANMSCYIPAMSLSYRDMTLTITNKKGIDNEKRYLLCMRNGIPIKNTSDYVFERVRSKGEKAFEITGSENAMQNLRGTRSLRRQKGTVVRKKRARVLLRKVCEPIQGANKQHYNGKNKQKVRIRKNEKKQSYEKCGGTGKSFHHIKSNGMEASQKRWQRKLYCTTNDVGMCAWMGNGSSCPHKKEKGCGVPDMLQNRRRERFVKNSHRSRRRVTPRFSCERNGFKKDCLFGVSWVESIEVFKHKRDRELRELCPDGLVYNIEVEKHHNYFANGILVHNCHHTSAGSWKKILNHYCPEILDSSIKPLMESRTKILGVTATPHRLDGKGLGKHAGGFYDALVHGPTIVELIKEGYLTKPVVYAPPTEFRPSDFHTKFGDYDKNEINMAVDKPKIVGNAVAHYLKICPDMPAIAFCASVAHAQHVSEQFNKAGVPSECLDGKSDEYHRKYCIAGLGDGRIRVLTSCEIISEGVDIPIVGAAILLRPTMSLSLYLQQVGRVLRPYPGKDHSVILDHVGNIFHHGPPDLIREWSLDGVDKSKKRADDAPEVLFWQCKHCYVINDIKRQYCYGCGEPRETAKRFIDEIDGELERIETERLETVYREQLRRDNRREEGMAQTLEELYAIAKKRGYKPAWARMRWLSRRRKGKVAVQ